MSLSDLKLRMGVPVATPVDVACLRAGARALLDRRDATLDFERDLQDLLGASLVRGTNSGRAALYAVLLAMRRMSSRDEVVLPAFACPSIGRAVVKAGLKAVLCDVEASGSGLEPKSLERAVTTRTLAVVAAHLYGCPCELAPVLRISRSAGAMVIEDCAQAFGARLNGRFVGTLADAGVFSFGMSKPLWTNGGGAICTSHLELSEHLDRVTRSFSEVPRTRQAIDMAKFAALSRIVRSHRLGPLDTLWGAALRGKDDCADFRVRRLPSTHAAAGRTLLRRLEEINEIRRRNAVYFSEHLTGCGEICLPELTPDSEPIFLRFPVIVNEPETRRQLIRGLHRAGINASRMYERESYEGLKTFAVRPSECARTEYLVDRMLNLPTHAYMRSEDLSAAVDIFKAILGRRPAEAVRSLPAAVH